MKSQSSRDVAALVPNTKVNWAREGQFLTLTMLCSIIAVFFLFQLWSFHPFIPISYDGDAVGPFDISFLVSKYEKIYLLLLK